MRMLLAVDRSPASDAAVSHVASRPLPEDAEVEVLTVVHSAVPLIPDPALALSAAHVEDVQRQRHDAPGLLRTVADRIRHASPGARVTWKIREGSPKDLIVQEAEEWGADVIVLGTRRRSPVGQVLLGSTATSVASSAGCAVEIISSPRHE